MVGYRAGRVGELTRSSRSEFKMIWHQFSTVQFPSHQLAWEVCLVHLMGPPIFQRSVSSVSSSLSLVQFDIQFSKTPDGAPLGVLLGIPRRVPVKLSRKAPSQ